MARQVFFDPHRKRWRRMRPLFDAAAFLITLVFVFFVWSVLRGQNLPALVLAETKPGYKPYKEKKRHTTRKGTHRKTTAAPSQVVLNTGEGIRAAFYVTWEAGSFASLREYAPQIDLLYPEWLHVLTPDGHLQAQTLDGKMFDVLSGAEVRPIDERVMKLLAEEKADTEVFPLVNNFDPVTKRWITDLDPFLNDPRARARFRRETLTFLASDKYRGLSVDFEAFPLSAQPGFRALLTELGQDLHARGLKLYVNLPTSDEDFDYAYIARQVDGIVLMNYDQHSTETAGGPIAAQDWYVANLQGALKLIPKEKIIAGIGNYGYDWPALAPKQIPSPDTVETLNVQESWLRAQESEAQVELDADALNSHFAYLDEHNTRHDVWFLDAVTALDQMRGAEQVGISAFALWRLGAEDRSLWSVWDHPSDADAAAKLATVPAGHDVDLEGHGEILRIEQRPAPGKREVSVTNGLLTGQRLTATPTPYVIRQYGARQKMIVLSFDDGPDPQWTPKVLDVLKQENAPGIFFLIGSEAEKNPGLMKRIYAEGHEIGNHTFFHPDISSVSHTVMAFELNLTERLFAAKLGVKPLFFRPPYSIDQEPDIDEQVRPLEIVQDMGYITVGTKLDPNDWRDRPRRYTAEEITENVLAGLVRKPNGQPCTAADPCGNVVLLHDGGGDRRETVRALPMIIRELRARGYQIVSVADLLGKTRAQVMPPLSPDERWSAQVDSFAFWVWGGAIEFIVLVFFVGDVLMSARLLVIGALAVFDRVHPTPLPAGAEAYRPAVAVLIPAYNEEKVIERTVRAVLRSKYPSLRAIVIDDGSTDSTASVVREHFPAEIGSGKVVLLTKPNAGKAEALNHGLAHVTEEIFIGIDADTVVGAEAIARLVEHFLDARVAAVAGNTKVGNRVNIWTRWQALEYITSQNFERRALDVLGAVSVVPGALGAWRTSAVRAAGAYHIDTVAEDADLTMSLLQHGYRVVYDDRALAFTEAPMSASGLLRQRFRWSFGVLQAVWKHREAFGRRGTLGWVALPNIVVFQIMLPLVSPFIDLMYLAGALWYLADRHFHPETANPANIERLTLFFAIFLVVDLIASALAFSLERRETTTKKDMWLLSQVWLQRFAYRQLFSLVLFKTLKRALDGRPFAWDKLERTAGVGETEPHLTSR